MCDQRLSRSMACALQCTSSRSALATACQLREVPTLIAYDRHEQSV